MMYLLTPSLIHTLKSRNNNALLSSPFFSSPAFFSYLFLGEQFGPQGFLGTILILSGVWFSSNSKGDENKNENEIQTVASETVIEKIEKPYIR